MRAKRIPKIVSEILFFIVALHNKLQSVSSLSQKGNTDRMTRPSFLKSILVFSAIGSATVPSAYAFATSNNNSNSDNTSNTNIEKNDRFNQNSNTYGFADGDVFSMNSVTSRPTVAYKSLSLNMPQFGVDVPVALWFKPEEDSNTSTETSSLSPMSRSINANQSTTRSDQNKKPIMDYPTIERSTISISSDTVKLQTATYSHRISVKKIGSLLAGLSFIPEFFAKDFTLNPTSKSGSIVDGSFTTLPSTLTSSSSSKPRTNRPIVILAHGFLGSRFDLSHLAEELALQDFIVLSPEYPESLSSSYPSVDNLDRSSINEQLLKFIDGELKLTPSSYGIVGHSLGTGTVMTTGDNTWTRVCIAGPPIRRDGISVTGNTLAITSVNDGAVSLSRIGSMIPESFVRLDEKSLDVRIQERSLPSKSILIIDRDDAPNHISFLAGNVNDSMVDFLSPLLPVAQALKIPVLDFDKYKESRDSEATADVVIPLVVSFLKQYMV